MKIQSFEKIVEIDKCSLSNERVALYKRTSKLIDIGAMFIREVRVGSSLKQKSTRLRV